MKRARLSEEMVQGEGGAGARGVGGLDRARRPFFSGQALSQEGRPREALTLVKQTLPVLQRKSSDLVGVAQELLARCVKEVGQPG